MIVCISVQSLHSTTPGSPCMCYIVCDQHSFSTKRVVQRAWRSFRQAKRIKFIKIIIIGITNIIKIVTKKK